MNWLPLLIAVGVLLAIGVNSLLTTLAQDRWGYYGGLSVWMTLWLVEIALVAGALI